MKPNNQTNTVLVIGSNSFSGSDFIDYLLEDTLYQVIGISRSPEKEPLFLPYKKRNSPSFRFYQLDVNHDTEKIITLCSTEKINYIINFAAQTEVGYSWNHPEQWFQTNTVAVASLCNKLKNISTLKKYIHISTPEVYGSCSSYIFENTPVNPSTPYAVSKAAADLFLSAMNKQYGFPVLFVRSTNVYGAHQQLYKIIPRSIIYLLLGKTIELHGGGKAIKSYIHIRDVSMAEKLIMEKGAVGEIYHISPKEGGISIENLVRKICDLLGYDFNRVTKNVSERLGQDLAYTINSTKIAELGWQQHISLQHGLEQVITWVNAHFEKIKNSPLEYSHYY